MKFADYLRSVAIAQGNNPAWRMGQTYFNVLYKHYKPELADSVRGSYLDPFHRDEEIPNFLVYVLNHWDD